jgi:translation elongation factor EF-G
MRILSFLISNVISDTMKDGTTWFEIDAQIPVIESFGLCDELRRFGSR